MNLTLDLAPRAAPWQSGPDIAEMNLQEARGLPGSEGLDVRGCLQTLDAWAARVQAETERLLPLFSHNPARFNHRLGQFRAEVLVTVLQRDLGVRYRDELKEMPDREFYRRSEHLFIHGVLQGKGGTCASLPPLYVAVGRRLGYPLYLATTFRHCFARWDDPSTGERFNIECTSLGFVSHPDEQYLHWPQELSAREAEYSCVLRSLTARQEHAEFLGLRGACLQANGKLGPAASALAQAANLDPAAPFRAKELGWALEEWERVQRGRIMEGFPPMRVNLPPRQFPNLPPRSEGALASLWAREFILDNAEAERQWWGPMRRQRGFRPPDLPACITVSLPFRPGKTTELFYHDCVPSGFAPLKAGSL